MIFSVDAKNTMLQSLADALNSSDKGFLTLYIDDALAAEIALRNPAQSSISNGVMTFYAPDEANVSTTGVPTSAKLVTSEGVVLADIDVATEITLDKDKLYRGGYVRVDSFKISI